MTINTNCISCRTKQKRKKHTPIVGMVVTISPSLSLYRMVVFPAASKPTIRIRISFFPKRFLKRPANMFPMVADLSETKKQTNKKCSEYRTSYHTKCCVYMYIHTHTNTSHWIALFRDCLVIRDTFVSGVQGLVQSRCQISNQFVMFRHLKTHLLPWRTGSRAAPTF